MMRQLAIVFLLYTIEQSYSHMLIADGRPRDKVGGQVLSVALFAIGLLPAFDMAGLAGVVTLLAVTSALRILWMAYQLFGLRAVELAFDVVVISMYFALAHVMHAAVGAHASPWYQATIAFAVGASALLVAMLAYRRLRRLCEAS